MCGDGPLHVVLLEQNVSRSTNHGTEQFLISLGPYDQCSAVAATAGAFVQRVDREYGRGREQCGA